MQSHSEHIAKLPVIHVQVSLSYMWFLNSRPWS